MISVGDMVVILPYSEPWNMGIATQTYEKLIGKFCTVRKVHKHPNKYRYYTDLNSDGQTGDKHGLYFWEEALQLVFTN